MHRRLATLTGVLSLALLAACGRETSDYDGLAPAAGRTVTAPDPPLSTNTVSALTPSWSTRGEADSVTIALVDVAETPPRPVLTMTCARGAVLTVASHLFTQDARGDQLQLNAGEASATLTVIPGSEADGVKAEGPAVRGLLSEITVGRPISLSYGDQTLGPLPPAPAPMNSRFATRCRTYLEPPGR